MQTHVSHLGKQACCSESQQAAWFSSWLLWDLGPGPGPWPGGVALLLYEPTGRITEQAAFHHTPVPEVAFLVIGKASL